jgi:hypothetical protein
MMNVDKRTCSSHRSRNQPSGEKTKVIILQGRKSHKRLPEGSSVATGEQSSTYRRTRHNKSLKNHRPQGATRSLMRNTKALIKLLMPTTPLRDLTDDLIEYWDVNTESSRKSTHAGG